MARLCLGTLRASAILLAWSEYIFANEGPVIAFPVAANAVYALQTSTGAFFEAGLLLGLTWIIGSGVFAVACARAFFKRA